MTAEESVETLDNLEVGLQYELFTQFFKPSPNYKFPSVYNHGCNRRFNGAHRFKKYPWLVHSDKLDGVFCIACVIRTP